MCILYHKDPIKNEYSKLKAIATSLSKYNLIHLLKLSSFLSLLSSHDEEMNIKSEYRNTFHYLFVEWFCKAILLSHSRGYKDKVLDSKHFIKIYKKISQMNIHFRADEENKVEKEDIYSMLSILTNTQCHHQDRNIFIEFGRQMFIYDIIPDNYKLKLEKGWLDFLELFEKQRHVNYQLFFLYHCYHYVFWLHQGKEFINMLRKANVSGNRVIDFFNLLDSNTDNFMSVDVNKILIDLDKRTKLKGEYLAFFFSIELNDLKDLKSKQNAKKLISDYQPFRFCPLIEISKDKYIIPSFYDYKMSILDFFPNFIDSQKISIRSKIHTQLGYCYEKYVLYYLQEKLSNVILIPEISFIDKGSDLGPDVVVIDNKRNILIAIEVKKSQIKTISRHNPSIEEKNELKDISLDAMYKLNNKLTRIFNYEGEYRNYKDVISTCKIETSFSLVVCGDYGYFNDKIIKDTYKEKHTHINDNYLFLDIPNIEDVIEYTAQNSKSFSDSLKTYIDIVDERLPSTNISLYFKENLDFRKNLLYLKINELMQIYSNNKLD